MAYTRSEVVLSTDPLRIARDKPVTPTAEEVVRVSLARRVPPRDPREWHRIFGADR